MQQKVRKLHKHVGWISVLLIVMSCQREAFQPDAINQSYLTLGKGGGIANQVDTYYVLADGFVYQTDEFSKAYQELGRLDSPIREHTFERATSLADSVVGYQEPGNLYYFLTIHTSDTTHSYTWGSSDFDPSPAVTDFYRNTQKLIQSLP